MGQFKLILARCNNDIARSPDPKIGSNLSSRNSAFAGAVIS
ncbi:MAG: hypothetical protein V7K40_27505 [Nostoc sp.]